MSLLIHNLHASSGEKEILKGVSFEIKPGEVHVIMGPNGSGKSTLVNTIMGHPAYSISKGTITIDGVDMTTQDATSRSRAGLFLSMQHAPEIPGLTMQSFLRASYNALHPNDQKNPLEFHGLLQNAMKELGVAPEFATRHLNKGFSGGEKKRGEILQLLLLKPTYALLDETDSGLDVDALKVVGEGITQFKKQDTAVVLITHYTRILQYVTPDVVHIMKDGVIIKTGGPELAKEIEDKGFN
ncbi:Fe-S cluster assembly ATPase SufC [Candidatus Falkowbacteria bacterium]|nr:Fe-S cluster assembly ATPase SufC [Candidatus Falkowbacteria bacterium]